MTPVWWQQLQKLVGWQHVCCLMALTDHTEYVALQDKFRRTSAAVHSNSILPQITPLQAQQAEQGIL
jgi:hypothetical protein